MVTTRQSAITKQRAKGKKRLAFWRDCRATQNARMSCHRAEYPRAPPPAFLPQPEVSDVRLRLPTIQLYKGKWQVFPAHFRDAFCPFAVTVHGWTQTGMFAKLVEVMKIMEGQLWSDERICDGPHVKDYYHHRLNPNPLADRVLNGKKYFASVTVKTSLPDGVFLTASDLVVAALSQIGPDRAKLLLESEVFVDAVVGICTGCHCQLIGYTFMEYDVDFWGDDDVLLWDEKLERGNKSLCISCAFHNDETTNNTITYLSRAPNCPPYHARTDRFEP
jgi:hypothetical protein